MSTTVLFNFLPKYIDDLSLELYSKEEWDFAKGTDELLGLSEHYQMSTKVFDVAFERHPELFEGCQWFNNEDGLPLWVRPGVEWVPDDDED